MAASVGPSRTYRTEAAPYTLPEIWRTTMKTLAVGLLLLTCAAAETLAQATEGSIRGYLRDEQGAVLPGVSVTATSPTVGGTYTAVTDQDGHYRLLNLPPGHVRSDRHAVGLREGPTRGSDHAGGTEPDCRHGDESRRARGNDDRRGRDSAPRDLQPGAGRQRERGDGTVDPAGGPPALVRVPPVHARRGRR